MSVPKPLRAITCIYYSSATATIRRRPPRATAKILTNCHFSKCANCHFFRDQRTSLKCVLFGGRSSARLGTDQPPKRIHFSTVSTEMRRSVGTRLGGAAAQDDRRAYDAWVGRATTAHAQPPEGTTGVPSLKHQLRLATCFLMYPRRTA